MLYIKAVAASMAGAWFILWPVRPVCGLYGPCENCEWILIFGW